MNVEDIRKIASPACREFTVRRLCASGSLARGTAGRGSDVDLLVEFNEPERCPAKRFFGLRHRLVDGPGCDIDLLTDGSLRNPHFKARVLAERTPIYGG